MLDTADAVGLPAIRSSAPPSSAIWNGASSRPTRLAVINSARRASRRPGRSADAGLGLGTAGRAVAGLNGPATCRPACLVRQNIP
jgi:hypothetical protein